MSHPHTHPPHPPSGISGLSFGSTLLSTLLFFCQILLLDLFYLVSLACPFSWTFPENSSIFFVKRMAFLYESCLAARRSKLVGGMCSMLPYGTDICCYAYINYFLFFIASVNSFFYTFFQNLVLIDWRNGPRYQRVLALCAFLSGAILKWLILREKICLMFVYVFCTFVSGLI